MIKPLLILMSLGVGATSMASVPVFESQQGRITAPTYAEVNQVASAVSRAGNGNLQFGYCGDPASAYYLSNVNSGSTIRQVVGIPDYVATAYAGNTIKTIYIGNPTNTNYVNPIKSVNLIILEDLNGEPVYTQEAKLTTTGFNDSRIDLTTPYEIKADTPVYFGYELKVPSSTVYYIVYSDSPHYFTEGGLYSVNNGEWAATDYNLMIKADLAGDVRPTGLAIPVALDLPRFGFLNEDCEAKLSVFNFSAENIENVEIKKTFEDNTTDEEYTTTPFGLTSAGQFNVPFKPTISGSTANIKCQLTKVNGQSDALANIDDQKLIISGSVPVLNPENNFVRRMVIEEATGTWCGYCPLGYVALENARERYAGTDLFIPIAVHDGDRMAPASYKDLIDTYITGFPQFLANRIGGAIGFSGNPNYNDQNINALFESITADPSLIDIDFNIEVISNTQIKVTTYTKFAVNDDNNSLRLAFVVKEDGVGPYAQSSYVSGTSGLGAFSGGGSSVAVKFNDVARIADTWNGIAGSLPESVEAGETYTYERTVSINSVTNKDKFDVVVMAINSVTGEIENAKMKQYDADHSSLGSIADDTATINVFAAEGAIIIEGVYNTASIYTVDGRLVKTAAGTPAVAVAPGLYIVKAGDTVAKVNVR